MISAGARGLTLVANPTAGGGRAAGVLAAVTRELDVRAVPHATILTRDAAHAAEAARDAADGGDVVVAVGGDGMLRIVAHALIDRPNATMAVVAAGRGNDFVRALGLPSEPAAIAEMLATGTPVRVDCGRAVGTDGAPQRYLTIAACGFDSEANRIANGAPSRLGPFVYVWGMIGALSRLRPVPYRLTIDGTEDTVRGLTVVVANTHSYGGGMRIAPGATATDGRFDIVLIKHAGRRVDRSSWRDRLRLVRALPRLFRGTHVELDAVEVRHAGAVHVAADAPLAVFADGDQIGCLPTSFSVEVAGLELLVPAEHPLTRSAATASVTA